MAGRSGGWAHLTSGRRWAGRVVAGRTRARCCPARPAGRRGSLVTAKGPGACDRHCPPWSGNVTSGPPTAVIPDRAAVRHHPNNQSRQLRGRRGPPVPGPSGSSSPFGQSLIPPRRTGSKIADGSPGPTPVGWCDPVWGVCGNSWLLSVDSVIGLGASLPRRPEGLTTVRWAHPGAARRRVVSAARTTGGVHRERARRHPTQGDPADED